MAYQHWNYETLHRFCMDAFQKFGFSEKEVAAVERIMKDGIPVNDNTMVEVLDLCNYLDMDFASYFGDYHPPVKEDVFKGKY